MHPVLLIDIYTHTESRDVRLQEGFVNLEPLPQGGFKPKIPEKLLQDKRRTQKRFKAMKRQSGGGGGSNNNNKERRGVSITTRRINGVLKVIYEPFSLAYISFQASVD